MFIIDQDYEDIAALYRFIMVCFGILLVWFVMVSATLSSILIQPVSAWKACGINRALCGWLVFLLWIIWVPYYWWRVRPRLRQAGGI